VREKSFDASGPTEDVWALNFSKAATKPTDMIAELRRNWELLFALSGYLRVECAKVKTRFVDKISGALIESPH
jgi:hypothetical protein